MNIFHEISFLMPKSQKELKKTLISKNKVSRYLKYAIGEILLVVIGILIAVSINNWNEKRKQKNELEHILSITYEDMAKDTALISEVLLYYERHKPIFEKIMHDSMSLEDFQNCDECIYLITSYHFNFIHQNGFNQLNKYIVPGLTSRDSLVNSLLLMYSIQMKRFDLMEKQINEDIIENMKEWRDEYVWFTDFLNYRSREGFVQYMYENPEFRNKVSFHYGLLYMNYVPELEYYKKELPKYMLKIRKRINP